MDFHSLADFNCVDFALWVPPTRKMNKRQGSLVKTLSQAFFSVAVPVIFLSIGTANVAMAEIHCQRTCNRCCIPKHNYGHDTPRFGATEFAVANAVDGLQRKPFHFRATALKVDHLLLDQVGLVIYKDQGKLVATGRITHSGGDGGLIGNNVTIRIRAYAAASADPTQIPPDAVVVWESEHNLWVSRGRPQHISLVPTPKYLPESEKLGLVFDQITHLEIELEYQRDR